MLNLSLFYFQFLRSYVFLISAYNNNVNGRDGYQGEGRPIGVRHQVGGVGGGGKPADSAEAEVVNV